MRETHTKSARGLGRAYCLGPARDMAKLRERDRAGEPRRNRRRGRLDRAGEQREHGGHGAAGRRQPGLGLGGGRAAPSKTKARLPPPGRPMPAMFTLLARPIKSPPAPIAPRLAGSVSLPQLGHVTRRA